MGDVRDILQVAPTTTTTTTTTTATAKKKKTAAVAAKKPKNMSREVFNLQSRQLASSSSAGGGGGEDYDHTADGGGEELEPQHGDDDAAAAGAISTSLRKFKIDPSFRARHWQWGRFPNSARRQQQRTVDLDPVMHWTRSDTPEADYPFCRFNKPCYVVQCTSEREYAQCFGDADEDGEWTQQQDLELLALCKLYDCRWPVVSDRLASSSSSSAGRSASECRLRYFVLAKALIQHQQQQQQQQQQQEQEEHEEEEEEHGKLAFDCRAAIRAMRLPDAAAQASMQAELGVLDRLYFQSPEDQQRELELLAEMKQLDDEIKRAKQDRTKAGSKRGKQAASAAAAAASSSSSPVVVVVPEENEACVADLPRLLSASSASASELLPCWRRSATLSEPPFVLAPSQHKQFASLCNVKPAMPSQAVLQAYHKYRNDSLRLAVYQHCIKRRRMDLKKM